MSADLREQNPLVSRAKGMVGRLRRIGLGSCAESQQAGKHGAENALRRRIPLRKRRNKPCGDELFVSRIEPSLGHPRRKSKANAQSQQEKAPGANRTKANQPKERLDCF